MTLKCPLCERTQLSDYAEDRRRSFFQCQHCALVFANPASWPDPTREKAEYDLHENHPDDDGYQRFLARMTEALHPRLPTSSRILDFGCGPSPVLAQQLSRLGHKVAVYDLFYYPDTEVLDASYDAIVMTEVIEHLHEPARILNRLTSQLHSRGVLAIMTQRVISQERFRQWNYKNDPTHVCFYSDQTFQWLARKLNARLTFEARDLVFLSRR